MAESDWKYLQYNIENGQKRTSDGPSGGPSSLADLDDTSISNPSDGQMLGYDETEGKWINVNAPAGSVTDVTLDNESVVDQNGVAKLTTPNIDALGKTAISNPADGEMLGYDETEGKWKNVPAPGGNVNDVEVNGVSVVNAQKVAKITSYKEVTQAQYEALPDTKLNDGILYAIKDGGQAVDGFPPLIYSDEEREIGVWRDGKPLYQKTIYVNGNLATGDWTEVNETISDVDKIIKITGGCMRSWDNGSHWTFSEWGYAETSSVYFETRYLYWVSKLNYLLYPTNNLFKDAIFIIQYTKTTDTPGSGTWTTQGALTHHYSTDEHIVGTWIDGKPLYEKTITYAVSSGYSNIQTQAHGIANIDKITKCDCYVMLVEWSSQSIVPNGFYSDSSYACSGYANASACMLRYAFGGISGTAIFTLQYTKTTD